MRAVKDSPVTRSFRNHLRMSGREASKIGHLTARTSPRIRSIHDGVVRSKWETVSNVGSVACAIACPPHGLGLAGSFRWLYRNDSDVEL